jgi:hypothetical protein
MIGGDKLVLLVTEVKPLRQGGSTKITLPAEFVRRAGLETCENLVIRGNANGILVTKEKVIDDDEIDAMLQDFKLSMVSTQRMNVRASNQI